MSLVVLMNTVRLYPSATGKTKKGNNRKKGTRLYFVVYLLVEMRSYSQIQAYVVTDVQTLSNKNKNAVDHTCPVSILLPR